MTKTMEVTPEEIDNIVNESERKEDNRKFVTVAFNELDELDLEEFKVLVGIDKDATAMKLAMKLAKNVAQSYSQNGIKLNLLKTKASDLRKLMKIQQKREVIFAKKG